MAYREGFTESAGSDPAVICQGKIINVNMVNWTVDVLSTFDQKRITDIQWGSPYLHFNNGEGMYVVPEVGAQCMVAIPGDTSAPFVMSFVAPHEFKEGEASFDAGRPPAKPGDIVMRTRDDNFVVLHRGGVLQLGATEVAQRIYIPLGNLIMDISGRYQHYNTSGSVIWGIQEGPVTDDTGSLHTQCFRVHANDEFADVRVSHGKVHNVLKEPKTTPDVTAELSRLGIDEGAVIYEIVMAPGGFDTHNGNASNDRARDQVRFKYIFDSSGNVFMRTEGSVFAVIKKELVVFAREGVKLTTKKSMYAQAEEAIELEAKRGYAHVKAPIVKLGPGATPVARQGDPVTITLPVATLSGTLNGAPFTGVLAMSTPVFGTILSGSSQVLA